MFSSEKADKGKCPFMASELKAQEDLVHGEATLAGREHGKDLMFVSGV